MATNAGRNIGESGGRADDPAAGTTETPGPAEQSAPPADLKTRAVKGAQQLADRAQSTARSRIEERKRDTAYTLSTVATTLLQSGANLREDQQAMAGEYVERAARQIERAATYVQDVDLGEIVDNVEDFARKRPAVFVGAAFALGIVAARFLKSSRRQRHLADRQLPVPVSVEPHPPTDGTSEWLEHT